MRHPATHRIYKILSDALPGLAERGFSRGCYTRALVMQVLDPDDGYWKKSADHWAKEMIEEEKDDAG